MVFLLSENTKADSQKFLELSLPEHLVTLACCLDLRFHSNDLAYNAPLRELANNFLTFRLSLLSGFGVYGPSPAANV